MPEPKLRFIVRRLQAGTKVDVEVSVMVGVLVKVGVFDAVEVRVGVMVKVGEGVLDGVRVGEGVKVSVGVGDGVFVGVSVGVGVFVIDGVMEAVGLGMERGGAIFTVLLDRKFSTMPSR